MHGIQAHFQATTWLLIVNRDCQSIRSLREICWVKAAADRVVCLRIFGEGVAIRILDRDFDVRDLSEVWAVHHARAEQEKHCFDGHGAIELIVEPHVRLISRIFCFQLRLYVLLVLFIVRM